MPQPVTLQACGQGHVIHYPAALDDIAIESMQEIAFCSACECNTVHFVVIWAGDRARIMESGDASLFERFEATDWPEASYADEHGPFFYRTVANSIDIAVFQRS